MSWISTEGKSTLGKVPAPGRRKDGSEILGRLNMAKFDVVRFKKQLRGSCSVKRVAPSSF